MKQLMESHTTVPFSIAKAILCHRKSQEQKNNQGQKLEKVGEIQKRPIDIAGVVLSSTVDYDAKSASVLIGDHSLQPHQCARVQYWGLGSNDLKKWIEVSSGDVLRFNRVVVKRDYDADLCSSLYSPVKDDKGSEAPVHTVFDKNKNERQARMKKATTVICDFSRSWLNPEAGRYFEIIANSEQCKNPSSTDTSEEHVLMEKHSSMATPKWFVNSIVDWYEKRNYHCSTGTKLIPIALDATRDFVCKRRTITELHSVNLLSDVVVLVTSFDQKQSGIIKKFSHNKGWRGASLWNSSNHTFQNIAMLQDDIGANSYGEGSAMPLFHNDATLQSCLQNAHKNGQPVLITRVLTKSMSSFCQTFSRYEGDNNCLALTSTPETTAQVLEQSKMQFKESNETSPLSLYKESGVNFWSTSPPKQLGNIVVMAKLLSIKCHGKNLATLTQDVALSEYWPSPLDLGVIITKSNDETSKAEYRRATITLRTAEDSNGEIVAEVNGNILSALCGDCEPVMFTKQNVTSDANISTLASAILRGLLVHDILLEWNLSGCKGNGRRSIDQVQLPSLDFA